MRDEEPPLPPPSPRTAAPSRLRRTLHSFRNSFRTGSPFHIGSLKRSGSTKSSASDGEVIHDERTMRKKNKKQRPDTTVSDASPAASTESSPSVGKKKKDFLRRMGSIGRKKGEALAASEGEALTPEVVKQISNTNVDTDATQSKSVLNKPQEQEGLTPESAVNTISVTHAVATRPFAKAAWKRTSQTEMEKPIETPSESALRRRIAFVAQASAYLSEDPDDEDENAEGEGSEVGSLEEAVALARERLGAHAVSSSTSAHSTHSAHSRDNAETEEEGQPETDAMPAYGDIIVPDDKTGNGEPSQASPSERREHLYKILVIGELGTGKTSIIKRYVHQFFSQHYRATIGVDFALKVLNWDANTIIRLQLWDIAGQERFGNMTRVYYKEAVGAFIVFDVSRVATFDAVVKWKNDLDAKVQLPDGSPIPCILLANKCDQQKEGIVNTPAKMDEYCREKGFAGWFETSAKENINIEEAARSLVNKILLNDKLLHNNDQDGEKFALDHKIANGENKREKSKSCAC